MLKKFLITLWATGFVSLSGLCLWADFYGGILLDSLLFHLNYYKTFFTVFYPFSIGLCVLAGAVLGSGFVCYLLRKCPVSLRYKIMAVSSLAVVLWLERSLGLFSGLCLSREEDIFYNLHYQPPMAEFEQHKRPNLVLLVLESMEADLMSGLVQNENLLPELNRRLKYGYSFDNYFQTVGTWWTMGAMVGVLCGVPLSLPSKENSIYNDQYFLPNIRCLSDILAANDYELFFIKGSSARFAGLDIFLRNHGFSDAGIVDVRKLFHILPEQKLDIGVWGFADIAVYQEFKRRLIGLSQKRKPFFAVMQTIDTHLPFNKLPPHCIGSSENFADVFGCADKQAAEFVDWFMRQPFARDTVLVILGDHQFMEAYGKYNVWPENAKRTIFNLFINGKAEPRGGTDRYFTPFDMFPSLLESLGMKLAGHRAGLGVSVFAPKSEPTLLEQMGRDRLNDQLNGRSRFYKSFLN